jgi:hypothetical protein
MSFKYSYLQSKAKQSKAKSSAKIETKAARHELPQKEIPSSLSLFDTDSIPYPQ